MPPNILYLHSHDTGRYVQPYGHAIPTPNIQWLADQGVLFRNAFCAAPSCSGSRAALLTGRYCHSNGMIGLAHRGFALDDREQLLSRTLARAGYNTQLIGEQHVSDSPDDLGYHVVHQIPDTRVDSVAPAAIEALKGRMREPFFLSVGFFETHRSFFAPSSVRDRVYSLPPTPSLPDTPEIREDVAAYKASARALDHGVGAVLNALHETGLDERTLVICTTDHGLAFPGAKATLLDRGIGVMLIVRGPSFGGGRALDGLVSQLDVYPTICELAGIERPPHLQGRSLLGLVRGQPGSERAAIFAELTYHAAYEPQRGVRTDRYKYIRRFDEYPGHVLPNCDDSPSKDAFIAHGWHRHRLPRESLFDLFFDPGEARNMIDEPDYADVAADLRARLERWMAETDDPLLDGPVPAPAGAAVNAQDQRSAEEPPFIVGADLVGAATGL
ncbi:MAG: sulfatase [Solirubrobacteraceae bacterium]